MISKFISCTSVDEIVVFVLCENDVGSDDCGKQGLTCCHEALLDTNHRLHTSYNWPVSH